MISCDSLAHLPSLYHHRCFLGDIFQVIVPGLIDTTTARVEDPRLIAEDLLRYVRAAGHPGRVVASTDCGFASTARSTAITADLAPG